MTQMTQVTRGPQMTQMAQMTRRPQMTRMAQMTRGPQMAQMAQMTRGPQMTRMAQMTKRIQALLLSGLVVVVAGTAVAAQTPAQTPAQPYEPMVGQAGKDVVWVPTPEVLVEKMLDIAKVGPSDFVMDLGSGDGRNIIAAARRGARAVGVEFNPDMVALSRRRAAEAGVGDKATFVEGDMYAADISKANVLAIFLLPVNMNKLTPKFLDLAPGSRIVSNTFSMDGWDPDHREVIDDASCTSWCTALLWIVPAKVGGTWLGPEGELTFTQDFQIISGGISGVAGVTGIEKGRMRGDEIRFSSDGADYVARVAGDRMSGTVTRQGREQKWTATRVVK